MYYAHFGLSDAPFRITPHTEFFFGGAQRGPLLDALMYAITTDEGIIKVSGEVGTGKTMLCRMLMERLPLSVESIYIANPLLTPDDVLQTIARELGCELPQGARGAHLSTLQEHLIRLHGDAKRVVVLIDEAHAMPADTLEEIRLLSNLETQRHKLLHIVLFGQPELDAMLNRVAMRQLKDRITQQFKLTPLTRVEVAAYVDFRMRAAGYRGPDVFSDAAIRRIARASRGLTRRINILADKSLLAAFAAGRHAVGAAEAAAAVRDADLGSGFSLLGWRGLAAREHGCRPRRGRRGMVADADPAARSHRAPRRRRRLRRPGSCPPIAESASGRIPSEGYRRATRCGRPADRNAARRNHAVARGHAGRPLVPATAHHRPGQCRGRRAAHRPCRRPAGA